MKSTIAAFRPAGHFLLAILCIASICRTGPAHAEASETLDYEYYDAPVARGQTLLAALNGASPIREDGRTFHGHTKWLVRWHFRWRESGRSCRITSVKTTVATTITLPRISGGTPAQKAEFERFSAALKEHELGHRDIGKDAAGQVERAILAMPEMTDCKRLESAANETGYRVIRAHNEKDKEYDAKTRHGRSQGAWLER